MLFDYLVLAFRRLTGRSHRGRTFRRQQITLDHQTFVDCRFVGCTLVLLGSDRVSLEGCSFEGCQWAVAGFAGNTVQVLQKLSGIEGVAAVLRHTFPDVLGPGGEDDDPAGDPPSNDGPATA
jgi:hypothetical protein